MAEFVSLTGEPVDPNRFLTPYNASGFGPLEDHCMEERPGEGRGFQLPAGVGGVVAARRLAIHAEDGSAAWDMPTIDEETAFLSEITNAIPHQACAARGFRPQIFDFIVTNPSDVYKTAQEIATVDPVTFDKVVGATARVLESGLADVVPAVEKQFTPLLTDKDGKTVGHQGRHVMAIHATAGEHVLWDNEAAWFAGAPAYALNVGLYPDRAEDLNLTIGRRTGEFVDPQIFAVAGIMYAAATIHHLPKHDEQAPQVVRVPAAA